MSGPFKMSGSQFLGKGNQSKSLSEEMTSATPNEKPKAKVTTKYNQDGSYTKSDGERSTTYKPNPNYKKGSARTGNYRFVTGETDVNGNPVGE